MKSMRSSKLLAGILLMCFTGCVAMPVNNVKTPSLPAEEDGIADFSYPPPTSEIEPPSLENNLGEKGPQPSEQVPDQEMITLCNNTLDMIISVPIDYLTIEEAVEPGVGELGPGESLLLFRWITDFSFETPSFSSSQGFSDLYIYGDGSASLLEFSGDGEEGYRLMIYNKDHTVPYHQYLLEPGMLRWLPVREGQKLFVMDLPMIPMQEILEIYPDAILPEGLLEVEWPGGYTCMLWCREPLYDVRICGTSFADNTDDGSALYHPVDWDSAQGFDLLPTEPLFTSMVSIGSSYLMAFRFSDSQEKEYIYLLGENGRGGDWPSLAFYTTENVLFAVNDVE